MSTETKLKASLQDFNFDELVSIVTKFGFPKYRAEQLYTLSMQNKDYLEATNLPKELLKVLEENYFANSVAIVKEAVSKDKTEKYLFKLNDGNLIEGVFMSYAYGNTLCVSTQVGCRMNCAFCASGLDGLIRNLTAGEILGQVLAVNRKHGGNLKERKVTNVVLMGSGEPLDNYDNVIKFLRLVSDERGINISLRNVSLSTCGIVPKIISLAEENLPVNLTISLHSANDEKREEIMPINKKYKLKELIDSAWYYFEKTHRRIIFEYTLIAGKNTDKNSAKELAALLKGIPCHVNLINLNYVKERGLLSANKKAISEFVEVLNFYNISNTTRRSMGSDIEGACGQLRRKVLNEN